MAAHVNILNPTTLKGWLLNYVNYSSIFNQRLSTLSPNQSQGSWSLTPVTPLLDQTLLREHKGLWYYIEQQAKTFLNLRNQAILKFLKKKALSKNEAGEREQYRKLLEWLQKCVFQWEAEKSNLWEPRRLSPPSVKRARIPQNVVHAGTDTVTTWERKQESSLIPSTRAALACVFLRSFSSLRTPNNIFVLNNKSVLLWMPRTTEMQRDRLKIERGISRKPVHKTESPKTKSEDCHRAARFLHRQPWSQIAPKQDVWLQLEAIWEIWPPSRKKKKKTKTKCWETHKYVKITALMIIILITKAVLEQTIHLQNSMTIHTWPSQDSADQSCRAFRGKASKRTCKFETEFDQTADSHLSALWRMPP